MINNSNLYCEIQINAGKLAVRLIIAAPMPREINNIGRAQQNKVVKEVNKARMEENVSVVFFIN